MLAQNSGQVLGKFTISQYFLLSGLSSAEFLSFEAGFGIFGNGQKQLEAVCCE